MSKIHIEIEDDSGTAARLAALAEGSRRTQVAAASDQEPEAQVFERALAAGAANVLYGARAPNRVLGMNVPVGEQRTYVPGYHITVRGHIPTGAEIVAFETSKEDGGNFLVEKFAIGWWDLVDADSSPVPLSDFRYLTTCDLLSSLAHRPLLHDVMVDLRLVCVRESTFSGARFHLFRRELLDINRTMVGEVACLHPEECVVPISYATAWYAQYAQRAVWEPQYARQAFEGLSAFGPPLQPPTPPPRKRFRCTRCWQEVVRLDEESPKTASAPQP